MRDDTSNAHAGHVAAALGGVLGDTFRLHVRVHGSHWNVTGPQFRTLHLMFEEQYQELWQTLDPIAERIRALGHAAPGSLQAIAELGDLAEIAGVPRADAMLEAALEGHLHVARNAMEALGIAEGADDAVTVDLLTQCIASHEKTAWMLRATLAEHASAA
jgi:starvation-inducible DNA-binding protein